MSATQNDIPQGFVPIETSDADTPNLDIIDTSSLRRGEVFIYRGVEKWTSARGDKLLAHGVQREGDSAATPRGIWSTAQLDAKLKAVMPGERVFIRWDGKEPHPTRSGQELHNWTVARATSRAES